MCCSCAKGFMDAGEERSAADKAKAAARKAAWRARRKKEEPALVDTFLSSIFDK
jgi:hypothetical protein